MQTHFTSRQLRNLMDLCDQNGVDHRLFQPGIDTGIFAEVFEALGSRADLHRVNRNELRRVLGLPPKDQYGRHLLRVVGRRVTGQQWLDRLILRSRQYGAPEVLLHPDYNEKHQAEAERVYTLAVISPDEFKGGDLSLATHTRLSELARKDYGVTQVMAPAEITMLLHEFVKDEQLARWRAQAISCPHDPLTVPEKHGHQKQIQLESGIFNGERCLRAMYSKAGDVEVYAGSQAVAIVVGDEFWPS